MKKELLIKYIKGEATFEEEMAIVEWTKESPENKEYLISLNNLWMAHNMPTDKASNEELSALKRVRLLKKRVRRNRIISYSAAALLILSIGVNFAIYNWTSNKSSTPKPILLSDIPDNNKVSIYTNNGVKGNIILPDGSVVWLNSASRITYPTSFSGGTREVELVGEAYFEVQKDSLHPMIISTSKDFFIKVTGTKFNLKAYDDDELAQATLYSGEIRVCSQSGRDKVTEELILKPMETVVIGDKKVEAGISQVKDESNSEWKEGILTFNHTPLSEVIKSIERWHGVTVTVADPAILNFNITASFNEESAVQIMDMIRYISPVDYKVENKIFILSKR